MKLVQAVIFFGTIAIFYTVKGAPHDNALAVIVLAVFMVLILTVIPWLIWQAIKQLYRDLKPVRGQSGVLQLPENSVPRAGVAGDFRPSVRDRL